MGLGDQFTGLNMENLIGGPLSAAAKASLMLADGTAHFINSVGFDENKKLRTVDFGYKKKIHNDDGSDSIDEMHIEAPLLSIVPIPNLQIDSVNIYFDMEVKESTQSESSKEMSATLTASGSIFGFSVSITGSVSAHESNSRSTDNSAKYHVDVTATNHGTPEGLNRILDIIAANTAPALLNSSLVDKNGSPLLGEAKARADKLKQLQAEKDEKSRTLAMAQKAYATECALFTRTARTAKDGIIGNIQQAIVKVIEGTEPNKETPLKTLHEALDKVRLVWTNLIDTAENIIAMASTKTEEEQSLTTFISLLDYDSAAETKTKSYDITSTSNPVVNSYKEAIGAFNNINSAQTALDKVEKEINQLLSGPIPQSQSSQ